ncbi:hypothetical protein GCM10010988_21070 [Cnuibacter physcomitrellae]|uniref:Uncharacterized protein n=1 Tax=Cnuibacter physcomitrellae TaxID=1619308 RepID=A0A1X9LU75_9MICO|nr:hypothetical protein [Cnuibacter physcomitrellae]ARJ06789.1 hypothetical protein B5808_17350 [Cnuibacter physcomitrellae]GGI38838.1 hypothetical protein GCM10010988_21070 [Cnuibacter physcomitrellae]
MAETGASTAGPTATRRWSRRRIVLTSVIGGVLLLAAVAWVVYSAIRVTIHPEDTVRDYLDLLAAGDTQAAAEMVDPRSTPRTTSTPTTASPPPSSRTTPRGRSRTISSSTPR